MKEDIYTTQLANIKKHLQEKKTITALEALNLYGCSRLFGPHLHIKERGNEHSN